MGRVQDTYIDAADLFLAGADRFVARAVGVTVRAVVDVPGWVGLVEADLSGFTEDELELRTPQESARCRVMFPADRTLVRGSGAPPREIASTGAESLPS